LRYKITILALPKKDQEEASPPPRMRSVYERISWLIRDYFGLGGTRRLIEEGAK